MTIKIIKTMGLFDFFKSYSKKPSIDLTDFKFLSDDHTRIENGQPTNSNNKGSWRGIRVKIFGNDTFYVTIYNMNENHPVWGDNIQMAQKQMQLVEENSFKIILRGFGTDAMGVSFADYGLTLHKSNGDINQIILHMYDRQIDIVYKKVENNKQSEVLNQVSDFDSLKNFTHKWNTAMSMNDKMQIAMQSDGINNKGANAYNEGDFIGAIKYFEQALKVMPNNDDALKNLKVCYTKIGNQSKAVEMVKRLNYLSNL